MSDEVTKPVKVTRGRKSGNVTKVESRGDVKGRGSRGKTTQQKAKETREQKDDLAADSVIGPILQAVEDIPTVYWSKLKHLRFMVQAVRNFAGNLNTEFHEAKDDIRETLEEFAEDTKEDITELVEEVVDGPDEDDKE